MIGMKNLSHFNSISDNVASISSTLLNPSDCDNRNDVCN